MTEKRIEIIALKVTKTEKEQIRAKAKAVGLGLSNYIRSCLYTTVMSNQAGQGRRVAVAQ